MWRQTAEHPAPLWRETAEDARFASHGGAAQGGTVTIEGEGDVHATSLVRNVQDGLARVGLYDGPASGRLDGRTVAAIERFEEQHGLPVTGEPSVALLAAVSGVAPTAAQVAPERYGTLGVADVQRLLNSRGFGPLAEDGKLGPNTKAALARFAANEGLPGGASPDEVVAALAKSGA
ncbi:peptidoglycan-binding protein [Acuticoccus sp.]|uniref:peptidoglycan-binding domain-containing protein n=1 Tax=Acuticoccus sp. TaxID=1904378 RepID=UPI003B517D2A